MEPRNKSEARSLLLSVWRGRPEADFGCIVIDFISENLDARHIPLSDFFALARRNRFIEQDVVLNVINYLTGAQLHLLETGFEYIEEDTVTLLDSSQVKDAYERKIDPLSGYVDEGVTNKIFMFLLPSQAAKSALRSAP